MKRFAGRETAILMLPLAGLALFLGVRYGISGMALFGNQSPTGLDTGPPRLELGTVQDVQPTALDVALGFSRVLTIPLWTGGDVAIPGQLALKEIDHTASLFNDRLEYRQGSKWVRWVEADGTSGIQQDFLRAKSSRMAGTLTLKVPLGHLPLKLQEVRLQANVELKREYYPSSRLPSQLPPRFSTVKYPAVRVPAFTCSRPLALMLRSASIMPQFPQPSRRSSFRITQVSVQRATPVDERQHNSTTQVTAKASMVGTWTASNQECVTSSNADLYDDRGRPMSPSSGRRGLPCNSYFLPTQSEFTLTWDVPTNQIPASAGPLNFRAAVSYQQGWPVWVSTPVRPAWERRKSKKILITGVSYDEGDPPTPSVSVHFRYMGNKRCYVAGEDLMGKWNVDGSQSPGLESMYKRNSAEWDQILVHWSQRLENGAGVIVGDELGTRRYPWAPTKFSPVDYLVTYPLDAYTYSRPGPLTFKAEIGVKSDGFVSVNYRVK